MMGRRCPAWVVVVLLLRTSASALAGGGVLDETSPMRRTYRFAPNRISSAVLKADGQKILDAARFDRLKQSSEKAMLAEGLDPAKTDWRDHAVLALAGARAFNPAPAAYPPADWTGADFDDAAWPLEYCPFQGEPPAQITAPGLGQYDGTVDLKLDRAYYRARFTVADPSAAGALTVQAAYAGGLRVFVNGREIARGHLPGRCGEPLPPETDAEEYPPAAYAKGAQAASRRTLPPARVPADCLRKGTNVLAVEVRASCFHPAVLTSAIQPNWGGPMRPFPHARLFSVELGPATAAVPSVARPDGVGVWTPDVHHRTLSTDVPPPGEPLRPVRLVGPRGASLSGQIAVSTTKPLTGLRGRCDGLAQDGGTGRIAGESVRVAPMFGTPADKWTMKDLGDERGLAAGFPDRATLAGWAKANPSGVAWLYDWIGSPTAAVDLPAGSSRPLWVQVGIPASAPPGRYRGSVALSAEGAQLSAVPVELEVVGWTLPDRKAFQTLVGCEENPYAVAKQWGVAPWSDEHFRRIEASFRQLGRIGTAWVNVPVLLRSEFGNRDDAMIRWTRGRDGKWTFDYTTLDRYLDLAVKHCGRPRVVHVAVVHGMRPAAGGPPRGQVKVLDQAAGREVEMDMDSSRPEARAAWTAFARDLHAHLKARGLDKAMFWGAPWEGEADPNLKTALAEAVPGVYWTAGPHEMMSNGTYAKDERYYRLVADIRYHGGWPSFRDDRGWKSKTLHLLNPRAGGTVFALHTTSHPFAYRVMVNRALAMGRGGFTRVGADEWAAAHYEGMAIPQWLTGIPVLWVLWPGAEGADSSARFEALIEGVQETEARIFIEQAIDGGKLPGDLAARAAKVLAEHFRATDFFQGNSVIHGMEKHHGGWQERSRRLYETAAEVAGISKAGP